MTNPLYVSSLALTCVSFEKCFILKLFNPLKDRQIQFWLPSKIPSDGKFEKSPNQPTEAPFSWAKSQKDAKLEMINDKNLLHLSNIDILDEIPPGNFSSSLEQDCSVEESQEQVEIIHQSAADECMNLENQSDISNDSISSEPTMPENGNGESSNSGTKGTKIIRKHPKTVLMQCNLDTCNIVFDKPENILPFEFKTPTDYKKKFRNQRSRFRWITTSLIENGLGEYRISTKSAI